jgi:hypothetical protein
MMLHLLECQGCQSKNIFFEPELIDRHGISDEETKQAIKSIQEILNPENVLTPVRLPPEEPNETSPSKLAKKK